MNHTARSFKLGEHKEVYPGLAQDSYELRGKLSEPVVCQDCGAVYRGGRWQWLAHPNGAKQAVCMACRRIADALPAGYVYIDGAFAAEHRLELLRLVRNHGERAKAEHPMRRIMSVEEDGVTTLVTTTDLHLARELGTALQAAFRGTLRLKYGSGEQLVRVHWRR